MKRIIILIIIMLLAFLILKKSDLISSQNKYNKTNTVKNSSIKPQIPEGWKIYTNDKLGISFATPSEYGIEPNGEYSFLAKPPSSNSPVGDTRFFYVSVVPDTLKNDNTGQIYNYSSSFHQKLLAIPVGEIKSLSELEGQKDWYMYERAGDDVFNGKSAKVFTNQRPWEFPNGTWEYRYVFEVTGKTVIAGAYIDGGPSDAQFTLPVLQQIMSTLVINE
jgi:hypothetical protein